jgi:hypothetical protein
VHRCSKRSSVYSSSNKALPQASEQQRRREVARRTRCAAMAVLDPAHKCFGRLSLASRVYECRSRQAVYSHVTKLRAFGCDEVIRDLRRAQAQGLALPQNFASLNAALSILFTLFTPSSGGGVGSGDTVGVQSVAEAAKSLVRISRASQPGRSTAAASQTVSMAAGRSASSTAMKMELEG